LTRALAPLPWREGDYGTIEDASGEQIFRLSSRFIDGTESWREITAEFAAAPDMRAALEALLTLIDRSEPRLQQSDAYHAAVAALTKAKGKHRW
jgi:hypothetical protein